jgi:hypothetical protein
MCTNGLAELLICGSDTVASCFHHQVAHRRGSLKSQRQKTNYPKEQLVQVARDNAQERRD